MKLIENYVNKVFCMDIIELLKVLPSNSIDCIIGDPDYNVGISYNSKKYRKSFDEYIKWYTGIATESLRVLKDDGNMFLINYPQQNAYLWVHCLDTICYDVQEYVWIYNSNIGHSPQRFTRAHRSILHCTLSKNNKFYKDNVAVPYKNPNDKRIKQRIKSGSKGRMPYSWFYYNLVKNVSKEKTDHPCQLPSDMIKLLIGASTHERDIVLTLFGGSGTEVRACIEMNRRFIAAEIDKYYYYNYLIQFNK